MANDHSLNPYVPPTTAVPESAKLANAQTQLDYGQSIRFVFESPDWVVNVFAVVLCTIVGSVIPILPAMVLLGYQFEIIERLTLNPHERYPSFRFDQILQYLVRGLYPILVAILASLVAVPVVLLFLALPIAALVLWISVVGEDGAAPAAFLVIPLLICFILILAILVNIIIVPMVLRAGLAQDIGSAFDLEFIKDFIRKMWKDCLKAGLFFIATAIVAQFLGALLLCIGSFFTMAIVQLAQAHLGMQLYRIFLFRGGEKIPLVASHHWQPTRHPPAP